MHSGTSQVQASIANVDAILLPFNPRRRAVLISSPPAGTLFVSVVGPGAATVGFPVNPTTAALYLTRENVGDAITNEITVAMSVAGPTTIGAIETFDQP